jgi:tetratricopeptide (TPR) repeat protein
MTVGTGWLFAQAPEKKWKDTDEYNLYTEITKTTDPAKKISLLDQWKSKYAETDFKKERLQLYIDPYRVTNQGQKLWDTCKEILAVDPKDVTSLYWMTALVETLPVTPETLDQGAKAANGLLGAEMPAGVKADDWKKMQSDFGLLAHKSLGFIATQKKDFVAAESEYKKVLEINGNLAMTSYALGGSIIAQKKPERYPEALFHFARSLVVTGPGELPPAARTSYDGYFTKVYNTYRGDSSKMADLKALAKASVMPPAGFTWTTKAQDLVEERNRILKENPALGAWLGIKDQLATPEGQGYFDANMKDAAMPLIKGKVISQTPEDKPNQIVIGVADATVGEVTLVTEKPWAGPAPVGTEISFEGAVAKAFTRDPFNLTMEIENEKVTGWPTGVATAAPPKKAAAKKAPVRKKK